MTRTTILAALALLAACAGGNQRILTGTLPAEADGAYARNGANRVEATLDGRRMTLDLSGAGAVQVFVVAGGVDWPLIFPADPAAASWDDAIPVYSGAIDLGAVSLVQGTVARTADEGEDHAEAEHNPLDAIDCDGDGVSDLDDDDDDDDGIHDDSDDDDDEACQVEDEDGDDDEDEHEGGDDD